VLTCPAVDAAALLHHVSGLVRRGAEVRLFAERHAITDGERACTHLRGGVATHTTDGRSGITDVVATEGFLNAIAMR